MRMGGPTVKQVRYAMHLMSEAGYGTRYMNSSHKDLGATMRERVGKVEDWLAGMSFGEVKELIDRLKTETATDPAPAGDAPPPTEMHSFTATDLRRRLGDVLDAARKAPVAVNRAGDDPFVLLTRAEFDRLRTPGATDSQ